MNEQENNISDVIETHLMCKRCKYGWMPRKKTQVIYTCPKCKSPYWDKDRVNKKRLKVTDDTTNKEV